MTQQQIIIMKRAAAWSAAESAANDMLEEMILKL